MSDQIEVFATPTCPYCIKLKEWLDEKGYSYEEYNVGNDRDAAKRMIERTGQRGVPQTFIGDKEIIGFQPEKVEEAIEEA
ncbi:glutaredoxin family protein [Candidatus Nanosalina sp. VS9-1]|uniref:glutaredoxin family protein n=1 Tax=Candidatus Nanosalina sp. VS9-1 TaxID=3388566 RepID=UPI0039DF476A